jgi:hypothetical protein
MKCAVSYLPVYVAVSNLTVKNMARCLHVTRANKQCDELT